MAQPSSSQPSLMTRLASALKGEVSADTVEAYRRAGQAAYEDELNAETLRRELVTSGTDLWSASAGQSTQLLCTWNAFALQTLGDQMVEADYRADSKTVGFLPPVTAEQAARLLGQVEQWSSTARRGAADPAFDVAEQMALPAPLPPWVEVEPCPDAHLMAMLAGARSMREHLEAALADFNSAGVPEAHQQAADRLRGMISDADSAAEYGQRMFTPPVPRAVHERVEDSLKRAVEGYFRVGQLLAHPRLLDRPEVQVASVNAPALPLPGQPGFDPWSLTDPDNRAQWQRDPAAQRAIDVLWRMDPNPAATLTIQAQIDAALAAGLIVAGVDGQGRRTGNYFCCPWAAIYLVRRPVTIAGRTLRAGEQFTYDVSAEEMAEGGSFKRELVVGPFHPTSEIDYCDPTAEGGRRW